MLWEHAKAAAGRVKALDKDERVLIVTHHDADGITAGAIVSSVLGRMHILHDTKIVPQLDEGNIKEIRGALDEVGLVWFTDIGSGALSQITGIDCVITDHHILDQRFLEQLGIQQPSVGDMGLEDWEHAYENALEKIGDKMVMVNPHVVGESGDNYISGAGVTYLVAKAL